MHQEDITRVAVLAEEPGDLGAVTVAVDGNLVSTVIVCAARSGSSDRAGKVWTYSEFWFRMAVHVPVQPLVSEFQVPEPALPDS